jgi:hypothetical protein
MKKGTGICSDPMQPHRHGGLAWSSNLVCAVCPASKIYRQQEVMEGFLWDEFQEEEDEEAWTKNKWGDLKLGKAGNKRGNFEGAYNKIVSHYFSGMNSVYDDIRVLFSTYN